MERATQTVRTLIFKARCSRVLEKFEYFGGRMLKTSPRTVHLTPQMRDALKKHEGGHKYDYGHAIVLAGGYGRGGAARLGARAALRVGAGLVTLLCPQVSLVENASQLTGVMVGVLADSFSLRGMLQDTRINALLLGPGLGVQRARDMVPAALSGRRATVLDADALSAFEDDPDLLFRQLHPACVLTPHAGEFARLFPDLGLGDASDGSAYSVRAVAVQAAAARAGCTVLLKGTETMIASPEAIGDPMSGDFAVHSASGERAAPWLATAGAGDVLAGLIVGLLARGIAPQAAAEMAAWLHVEAACHFGPGLIAEDLPDALPAVLRAVFAGDAPVGEQCGACGS
jgi:hydroxyethylthiazole kinase-like uncharacterized protein yjeF